MKVKRLIFVLIALCVAITFMGVVSAAEVEVAGEKFNVPDGFEENASASKQIYDSSATTTQKTFTNGTHKIIIMVDEFSPGKKPKLPKIKNDYENKTFNGVNGAYSELKNTFVYKNGQKLITISSARVPFEDIVIG